MTSAWWGCTFSTWRKAESAVKVFAQFGNYRTASTQLLTVKPRSRAQY